MKGLGLSAITALGAVVVIGTGVTGAPGQSARLLMVTHSAGYEHDVVRRPGPGRLATAEQVVTDLGRESGAFAVTALQDASELAALTPAALRQFRAVLLFTTGSVPLSEDTRHAFFEHVRHGAGVIGVHSAADTWYDVPEYGELLGGVFDGHPWHERVRVVVEDPSHAATAHLGSGFTLTDEIYQFRSWTRSGVHVLLRLDPRSIDLRRGKRPDGDYALAWTRQYGQGRVFYTALGHRPEVWADERFRRHLLGGIRWVMGR